MYHVIEPIKITNIFKLENYKPNLEELNELIKFINLMPISNNKIILNFLKYNPNLTLIIIDIIPISSLLKIYQDYKFIYNYIDDELYEHIVKKNNQKFLLKLFFDKNYKEEVIYLNNSINQYYNFSDKNIKNKYDELKNKIDFIDFSEFYIGSETVLYFSNKNSIQKNIKIKLYSKKNVLKLHISNKMIWLEDKKGKLFCQYDNYIIEINNYYFKNIGEILLEKDNIVFDGIDIYCKFLMYQELDKLKQNDVIYNENILNNLTKKLFDIKKFKKYKYKKPILDKCYICKEYYDINLIYERYKDMCLNCGKFNYDKRNEMADLSTNIAFVSGIRQKIGLAIALKLLRCGSKVIGTSRYSYSTLYNFAKQSDYNNWKNNLIICQCNFLNIIEVNKLIYFLKTQNINILINNACQTIRPSKYYYHQLNQLENILFDIIGNNLLEYQSNDNILINYNETLNTLISSNILFFKAFHCGEIENKLLISINNKIKLNKIKLNHFDNIQDIDIKKESSWNKNIDEINPGEILESFIINQTVPTLIINQLKKYMKEPKFIINVDCLEGQFSCKKNSFHAASNMSKAAMNMLIRTISEEKNNKQYVYSINCGFISGTNPQYDYYPLSPKDGASRILDPIIQYYKNLPLPKDWIKLTNYKPTFW